MAASVVDHLIYLGTRIVERQRSGFIGKLGAIPVSLVRRQEAFPVSCVLTILSRKSLFFGLIAPCLLLHWSLAAFLQLALRVPWRNPVSMVSISGPVRHSCLIGR